MTPSSPTRWEISASAAILGLATVSSLLGLVRDEHYVESAGELMRIQAQDAVIVVVGVPVLGIGLWYATRGSVRGRIVWLGSLAFMAYMWTHYAFVVAYNEFFLGYIALFSLSVFTLLAGTVRTDATAVAVAVSDGLSERTYAGFLAFAAVGLAGMWLSDIVPSLATGDLPSGIAQFGAEAAHTYVIDLGVLVPALAISAIWLRRERPWGYVSSGVLLVFAALVAPTLTAITAVDLREGVAVTTPILVGTIVPPLIGALFAGTYLANLSSNANDSSH